MLDEEKVKSSCQKAYVIMSIGDENYKPWHKRDNYTAHHTNGVGFVDYESAEKYCEDLPKLHLFMHDSGMLATHNIPCTVCLTKHAVFNTSEGRPEPCRDCQDKGYYIGKKVPSKWYEFWKLK